MSAAVSEVPKIGGAAALNRVTIKGKVTSRRRHDGMVYTLLTCPAPDEYSKPQIIEVRSAQPLGDRDEVVTIQATVGGYPNNFEMTDRDTGEKRRIQSARITLDAVE